MQDYQKEFLKILETFRYKYQIYDVYRDFLHMVALTFKQQVIFSNEDEETYLNIINKYDKSFVKCFPEMLSLTVLALNQKHQDFLGSIYMLSELGNKYTSQFFTPYHISLLMAQLSFGQTYDFNDKRLYTVSEPCVGAGGMVIACHEVYLSLENESKPPIYFNTVDVDIQCVHMAYIQFTILGIPAHVTCGNALTMKFGKTYPTPALLPIADVLAGEGIIENIKEAVC